MSSVAEVRDDAVEDREGVTDLQVSVVIPCLNEAESIEESVTRSLTAIAENGYRGEVVVADNGSEDGSAELAAAAGARVVHQPKRGYGNAYMAGLDAARGEYIVMLDADLTYDIAELPNFVKELDEGGELVMGNRLKNIQPGAMPWLHRYVGNPILTGLLNRLFKTGIDDAHCGMRAVRKDVLPRLALRTTGMEFASEMVIRAGKEKLDIRQFPIEYHPRAGESKLETWSDGWRHLRFLLVHSPTHLFLFPGAVLAALGTLVMATVLGNLSISGRQWDLHTMIGGSLMLIVGVQIISLGLCAHAYGVFHMGEKDERFEEIQQKVRLEHGLMLGGIVTVIGFILGGVLIGSWAQSDFGALSEEQLAILAATLITVGTQIFFASFLLSILGLRRRS